MPDQLQLPARRLAPAGAGAARLRPRLRRAGDHRRMLGGRRGARLVRPARLPGLHPPAGRGVSRPAPAAAVPPAVRIRVRLRRRPPDRPGARPARLGRPVRVHHRGAHHRAQGQRMRSAGTAAICACCKAARCCSRRSGVPVNAWTWMRCAIGCKACARCTATACWLAVNLPHWLDDDLWLADLREAGERAGVPLVASRRRAHACAFAQAAAGRDHRRAPGQAGGRLRPGAAGQCRAPPAPAQAPGRAVSARAAGPHPGGGRPLPLRAGGDPLRLPAGDRAARPDADARRCAT